MKTTVPPSRFAWNARAFSMLELVVVISLIALLAGVLAPIAFQSKKEAQAAKIVAVVDALTNAAERYYADNGEFPRDSTSTAATAKHDLTVKDSSLANWKGPYLSTPLTTADNPEGGAISLLNSLNGGSILPAYSGTASTGAVAIFFEVSEDVAQIVNQLLDGAEDGTSINWKTAGRVTFYAGTSGGMSHISPGTGGGSGSVTTGGSIGAGPSAGSGSGGSGSGSSGSGSGGSGAGTSTSSGGSLAGGAVFSGATKKSGGKDSQLNVILTLAP